MNSLDRSSFHGFVVIKVVRNKKWKTFLLPNMIELFETNRMRHFPPFYDDFSDINLTLKIGYFILQ